MSKRVFLICFASAGVSHRCCRAPQGPSTVANVACLSGHSAGKQVLVLHIIIISRHVENIRPIIPSLCMRMCMRMRMCIVQACSWVGVCAQLRFVRFWSYERLSIIMHRNAEIRDDMILYILDFPADFAECRLLQPVGSGNATTPARAGNTYTPVNEAADGSTCMAVPVRSVRSGSRQSKDDQSQWCSYFIFIIRDMNWHELSMRLMTPDVNRDMIREFIQ